jgi:hypothetical protein
MLAAAARSLTNDGCSLTDSCSIASQSSLEQLPGSSCSSCCNAAAALSMAACDTAQQQQQHIRAHRLSNRFIRDTHNQTTCCLAGAAPTAALLMQRCRPAAGSRGESILHYRTARQLHLALALFNHQCTSRAQCCAAKCLLLHLRHQPAATAYGNARYTKPTANFLIGAE